jgi:hypothetical protein
MFQVALASSSAQLLESEDGSNMRIWLTCKAPATLEVDDVRVCLQGPAQATLWFSSGPQTINEGINEIALTTFVSLLRDRYATAN